MRVRKSERRDGTVPLELLDLGHPVWRDAELYTDWCARHDLPRMPESVGERLTTWWDRFVNGRDQWSIAYGFTLPIGNTGQRTIDHGRLREAGVPACGSLTRAMARAESSAADPAAFRAACVLVPYGPVPDRYPAGIGV